MSLLQQSFRIILQQDVIFNAMSATLGGQQGLDYLPGSVFLGAVASRIYSELNTNEAWQVFHSGLVRFHDALPLDAQQQPAWPVPLNWHYYKGDELCSSKSKLDVKQIFDPAFQKHAAESRQPKQIRKGYVSQSGTWVQPKLSLRMKTAIDAQKGTAAESQLFGYQSVDAGQTYLFTLEAEPEAAELFDKVVRLLSGSLRLGRSRSAQYGRVLSEPVAKTDPLPTQLQPQTQTLTLWLLSDLALLDDSGQATLQPKASYLGLPDTALWDEQQSYIRTRRYSPFNAYRQAYEQERQVISRGSVLRYKLNQPLTDSQLAALRTVGLHTGSGLGRMAVNPTLLSQAQPVFIDSTVLPAQKDNSSNVYQADISSILLDTLKVRYQAQQSYNSAEQEAQRLLSLLLSALDSARSWKGIPLTQALETAPGRSQWGIIKELSSKHRDNPETLWKTIIGEQTDSHAVIGQRSGWELETGPSETLAQVFLQDKKLLQYVNQPSLAEVLGQLAAQVLSSKQWQAKVQGSTTIASGETA
jgi:hypothetical protein